MDRTVRGNTPLIVILAIKTEVKGEVERGIVIVVEIEVGSSGADVFKGKGNGVINIVRITRNMMKEGTRRTAYNESIIDFYRIFRSVYGNNGSDVICPIGNTTGNCQGGIEILVGIYRK